MPKDRTRILVVDSDEQANQEIQELCALYNYEVVCATTEEQALNCAKEDGFDGLLVAVAMPNGGFRLSEQLRQLPEMTDTPVIYVTNDPYDHMLLMEAQYYGGLFVHEKPYNEVTLLAQLSSVVRIKTLQDELKARMSELDLLAATDSLTGLYNRRMFFKRMEEELARASRMQTPLCLAYIDIDYFKDINDTHGHLAGDAVLIQLSRVLNHVVRKADVVGRIGGEEFAVLLPDVDSNLGCEVAERIRSRVQAARFTYGDLTIRVTVSIGVLHVPDAASADVDMIMRIVDEGMYSAKRGGRNRVVTREMPRQQPRDASLH